MQAARQRRQAVQLIRKLAGTHAAVADTTAFEELLDPPNTRRDVYADPRYPCAEREQNLTKAGWRVHIQRKGTATHWRPVHEPVGVVIVMADQRVERLQIQLALEWRHQSRPSAFARRRSVRILIA